MRTSRFAGSSAPSSPLEPSRTLSLATAEFEAPLGHGCSGREKSGELPASRSGVCGGPPPSSLLLHRTRCLSVVLDSLGAPPSQTPAASRRPVCNDAHVYATPRHMGRHGSLEGCLRRSREVYRGRFIQNAVCGLRKVHLPRTRGIGSLYTAASLLSGTTKTGQ